MNDRKLAALGLRVRKGRAFHGLSLNVDMDLAPFAMIEPGGYRGMEVTQLHQLGIDASIESVSTQLQKHLERLLDTSPHE